MLPFSLRFAMLRHYRDSMIRHYATPPRFRARCRFATPPLIFMPPPSLLFFADDAPPIADADAMPLMLILPSCCHALLRCRRRYAAPYFDVFDAAAATPLMMLFRCH